jgi:hypothetical protein
MASAGAVSSKITNAFLVTVDRQDRNLGATGGSDNSRREDDFGSLTTGTWIVAPKVADAQAADADIESADETAAGGEVRLGQGPAERIPLLAAGPSNGTPGEPERIEPVDPLEGALVDLTLVDLSPEVDPTALTPSDAAALMAEVGSVSGFPGLLGSELAPLTPTNVGGLAATTTDSPDTPAVSAQDTGASPAAPIEATSDSRATVGLGVLAGATIALLLPDLAARMRTREVRRSKPRGTRFARLWTWRLRFLRP